MELRAVVFDLFDTLVDLRFEDLPRMEHEGRRLPASFKRLHAVVAERRPLDFGELMDAETGRTRVRMVDADTDFYAHARALQTRILANDLGDAGRLDALARASGQTPKEAKGYFGSAV